MAFFLAYKMGFRYLLSFVVFLGVSQSVLASSRNRSYTRRSMERMSLYDVKDKDMFLNFLMDLQRERAGGVQTFEKGFFEWVPNGSLLSTVPPECSPEFIEDQLEKKASTPAEFAHLVQNYFNHCEGPLYREATGGLLGLIDFALVSYPFLENSKIKPFVFQNKQGRQLKGYLAIRDQTPRPWVVFKCGVFCSASEDAASIKNYLIHLFDQAPFNVIVLENRTGTEYIKTNHVFNFGGYFEAQDFVDVAQWLKEQSPFKSLVSSVHIVAVSLAGNGAYLAEKALNKSQPEAGPLVQSITSLCAVSDLKPTVDDMYSDSIKGFLFSKLTWYNLDTVKTFLPAVQDLLAGESPDPTGFPHLLARLVARYIPKDEEGPSFESPWLNPSQHKNQESDFWDQTLFSKRVKTLQIPLFVMASEDDSVVNFDLNTGALLRRQRTLTQDKLGIVRLAQGDHCGFATAHGYSIISGILRQFILMNSPEFKTQWEPKALSLKVHSAPLDKEEKIVSYWWARNPDNAEKISLHLKIFNPHEDFFCEGEDPYLSDSICHKQISIDFGPSFWAKLKLDSGHNEVEREAFVRQINSTLVLKSKGGFLVGASQWPDRVELLYNTNKSTKVGQ